MKVNSWKILLQIVLLFGVVYFGVLFRGDRGDLENPDVLRLVYNPLKNFNGWVSDIKFALRGDVAPKNKIVIVSIDFESVAKFGKFPWKRDVFARIFEEIERYHPRVIGSDLLATEDENRVSAEVLQELKNKGLEHLVLKLDTDSRFLQALQNTADRLVMGIYSQYPCQGTQSTDPIGAVCPVLDQRYEKAIEEGFGRFTIQDFGRPENFDLELSPLYISRNPIMNKPEFQKAIKHLGLFDIEPDPDGIIRSSVLVKFANNLPVSSFALEVSRQALNEELSLQIGDDQKIKTLNFKNVGRKIPINTLGRLEINFRGGPSLFPHLSVADLLGGEKNVPIFMDKKFGPPVSCESCRVLTNIRGQARSGYLADISEVLKDAIVLIGSTDLKNDIRPIPNNADAAGVQGHALIVDNLLAGDAFIPQSQWRFGATMLLALIIGAFLFGIAIDVLSSTAAILLFVFTILGMTAIDVFVLFPRGINLQSGLLYVEFFLIGILVLLNKYIAEENQRKFIKLAFSRFVSPQVVKTILEDPKQLALSGTRRELTVMFSDIRSFMPFSSRLEPQALHQFLNDYHDAMTRIVIEKGTLDKYIGDAIMAFWGAPLPQENHASNACHAAMRMMEELRKQNPNFKAKYGETVSIGIGINSGPVIVGNMGSKEVFSYTVIGDDVNLASRIERLTRIYGVNIVTTGATIDSIRVSGEALPPYRVLDRLKVLGSDDAVDAIQILDHAYPSEAMACYEAGRQAYLLRNWDLAIKNFQDAFELIEIKLGFTDHPSSKMIDRCQQYKSQPPPAEWDGVWQMTRK